MNFKKVKKILEKQKYAISGRHSAVQICRWTKNSLNKKGVCWKEKFYGIKSHRCCQMSPAVMWCENSCLHCWRPIEFNLGMQLKNIDEPEAIIDGIIDARKKLLMGFKGDKKVSKKKFEEALKPSLFTFSLSGEPTLYPYLGRMIKELRKRSIITFLVTNGLNPEAIEKMEQEGSLPTQLTVSINAGNEKLFKIWCNSKKKDAWNFFNKTLEMMKNLKGKTRRVLRLTLVKKSETGKNKDISNMEDEHIKEYAELIRKAEPDFIHIKGFMSIGYSRDRIGYNKQPWHYEIKRFADKFANELEKDGYKILGEEERSCVVVLGKDKKMMKIIRA